ncbi:SRPBCC family protein [Polaromonas sp. CT11-55]|uniref:SRPBCC family protein n=1 Tax=Polaromonas sp. CT11-55 TaxID=3243045 RepID=UPI0039A78039
MTSSTDRIERSVHIKAAPSRVWKALTNAEEFGSWFGVALKGKSFIAGQQVQGHITIAGYEHVLFDVLIDRVEPETLFSYRWHPYAVDPAVDYSKEPTTLVEFTLKAVNGGTLLSVVESGFDKIPVARRDQAFRMNDGGWQGQMANIEKYVSSS